MDETYTKTLLSACQSIAYEQLTKEGDVADEEAIAVLAYDLYKEVTTATEGTVFSISASAVIAKANEMLEANKNVESPYQEKKFDYQEFSDNTILPSVSSIMKLLGEYSQDITAIIKAKAPKNQKEADEQKPAAEKAFDAMHDMSIKAFAILNENKVGISQYKTVFEKIKELVAYLEQIQAQQLAGHRNEVLSRVFGGINPGTGKLDAAYATYAQLLDARTKAKAETDGPNGEDMFSVREGVETEDAD